MSEEPKNTVSRQPVPEATGYSRKPETPHDVRKSPGVTRAIIAVLALHASCVEGDNPGAKLPTASIGTSQGAAIELEKQGIKLVSGTFTSAPDGSLNLSATLLFPDEAKGKEVKLEVGFSREGQGEPDTRELTAKVGKDGIANFDVDKVPASVKGAEIKAEGFDGDVSVPNDKPDGFDLVAQNGS